MHFNTNIEINTVLEKCFEKEEDSDNPDLFKNNYYINNKKEKYVFKKIGGIFISVRLGVKEVPSEYYNSIKKVDSASYFFGYSNDNLLYLDPHINQQSDSYLDDKTKDTYINKTVYTLEFKSLQCAFTAGFLFRTLNEFHKLLEFFKKFNNEKCPCFHTHIDKIIEKNDEIIAKEIKYLENDQNDF